MNIVCFSCKEPWELYYMMHDENLIEEVREMEKRNSLDAVIEVGAWIIREICGWNEVPEGHMIIEHCPCCRKKKRT